MLGRELTAWAVATLGILIGPHPTPRAFGQEAASGRNRTTQAVTSDRTTISLDGEWQIEDGKSASNDGRNNFPDFWRGIWYGVGSRFRATACHVESL